MLVAQNLLDRFYIHAVLQHQRGGCMAKLMGRIFAAIQACLQKMLFYQSMDSGTADALIS